MSISILKFQEATFGKNVVQGTFRKLCFNHNHMSNILKILSQYGQEYVKELEVFNTFWLKLDFKILTSNFWKV